jgi:hypothetical protein
MALIPWRNQAKRRLNFIKSESEPILHAEQQFETSVMIAVVVLTALLALISARRTDSRGRGSPVKSCAAAQTISANAAAVELTTSAEYRRR